MESNYEPMESQIVKDQLTTILGEAAYNDLEFNVIRRLCFTVRYLSTQMRMLHRYVPDEDKKDMKDEVSKIIGNAVGILTKPTNNAK